MVAKDDSSIDAVYLGTSTGRLYLIELSLLWSRENSGSPKVIKVFRVAPSNKGASDM